MSRNLFVDAGLDMDDPHVYNLVADAVFASTIVMPMVGIRQSRGLSVEDVAERMGISADDVRKFERPGSNPHLSTLRRYAGAVGALARYEITDIPEDLAIAPTTTGDTSE